MSARPPRSSPGSASNHGPGRERARGPRRTRRRWRGRRRARRRSRRSPRPATSGSSASSAIAIAPEPVPRSATAAVGSDVDEREPAPARPAQPVPLGFLERDLHDLLGLRTRDEHPPVDHEVEAAERPRAEHVLQRFPATRRSTSGARRASGAFGRALVGDRRPLARPDSPTPPRRGTGPRRRRSRCPAAGEVRAPTSARVSRQVRAPAVTRPPSWRPRSSAASASTISSSSPPSTRSSACTVSRMRWSVTRFSL